MDKDFQNIILMPLSTLKKLPIIPLHYLIFSPYSYFSSCLKNVYFTVEIYRLLFVKSLKFFKLPCSPCPAFFFSLATSHFGVVWKIPARLSCGVAHFLDLVDHFMLSVILFLYPRVSCRLTIDLAAWLDWGSSLSCWWGYFWGVLWTPYCTPL